MQKKTNKVNKLGWLGKESASFTLDKAIWYFKLTLGYV